MLFDANYSCTREILKSGIKTFNDLNNFRNTNKKFREILNDVKYSSDIWISLIERETNLFDTDEVSKASKFSGQSFPIGNFTPLAHILVDLIDAGLVTINYGTEKLKTDGVELFARKTIDFSEDFLLILFPKFEESTDTCFLERLFYASVKRSRIKKREGCKPTLLNRIAERAFERCDFIFDNVGLAIQLDDPEFIRIVLKYEKPVKHQVEHSLNIRSFNALEAFLEKGLDLNNLKSLVDILERFNKDETLFVLKSAEKYGHPIDLYKKFGIPNNSHLAEIFLRNWRNNGQRDVVEALIEYRDYLSKPCKKI